MPTVLAMGEGDSVVSRVAREEEGVLPAAKPLPEKERAIYKEGRERERGRRKKEAQREKWETGAREG